MGQLFKEEFRRIDYVIPVLDLTVWSDFANQPASDKIEVVSNNTADTQKCTIWGTDHTSGKLVAETVTLTGTTAVKTTKATWGNFIGAFLGDAYGKAGVAATGTITFREDSADQAITTITANKISTGVVAFNLVGRTVSICRATGNVLFYPFTYNTTDYLTLKKAVYRGDTLPINLTCEQYLCIGSDASGATASIIVWK